jgi:hypothetical protein
VLDFTSHAHEKRNDLRYRAAMTEMLCVTALVIGKVVSALNTATAQARLVRCCKLSLHAAEVRPTYVIGCSESSGTHQGRSKEKPSSS